MNVPIVKTDRLRLRPHELDDFEHYHTLWNDTEIVRYISGRPSTKEETWARLLRHAGHWKHLGYGFWLIEEKATGNIVGEAGLLNLRRQITPSLDGTVETGWMLSPQHQGRGYALEAMNGVLDWAASNVETKAFSAIISPENRPSIQLAEKLGFSLSNKTEYNGSTQLLFTKGTTPVVQKNDT